MPEAEFLTTDEVAARYRTVPSVIRYWRQSGYGPGWTKAGRRVLYPRAEVEAFDRLLREQAKESRHAGDGVMAGTR